MQSPLFSRTQTANLIAFRQMLWELERSKFSDSFQHRWFKMHKIYPTAIGLTDSTCTRLIYFITVKFTLATPGPTATVCIVGFAESLMVFRVY